MTANKHILLVVDDDTLILNTLTKRFSNWDLNVYTATTQKEARTILDSVTPEVVILDLMLKGEVSEGLLDYMQSQERLADVPVLVLTNMDKPELRRVLLSRGVKEYIIKGSISLDDLYKKVVGYLEPQRNM